MCDYCHQACLSMIFKRARFGRYGSRLCKIMSASFARGQTLRQRPDRPRCAAEKFIRPIHFFCRVACKSPNSRSKAPETPPFSTPKPCLQALNTSASAPIPTIFSTRLKLYDSTCRLISVPTPLSLVVRKCVAPIQNFSVPNGCSTV